MRFLEIPALITEDIEDPDIVDITEPITASIVLQCTERFSVELIGRLQV